MRRWGIGLAAVVVAAFTGLAAYRAYDLSTAYAASVVDIDHLRDLTTADPASITPSNLIQARSELEDLQLRLERIDADLALPASGVVSRMPWIGRRYAATRDLVQIGRLSADAGITLSQISAELLQSLDSTGLGKSPGGTTWLDVVGRHTPEIAAVVGELKSIQTIRARLDTGLVPERVRSRLDQLDTMLNRPEVQTLLSIDISAISAALGGSSPARYLVLFQNPAELRPTGGFPGTMALITLDRGQLVDYQFFSGHELSEAYLAQRPSALEQPWPIKRFLPQPEFLLHDAMWWPDFPRSARQLMSMYAETDWPRIDGVIAVQPEVASLLVGITGPFTLQFQGEEHHITTENVYAEIDRARVQDVRTPEDLLVHKQLLGLIGKNLIDRLKTANRRAWGDALGQLGAACERRDVQIYASDPAVEAETHRLGCSGRLMPTEGEPTIAVSYANLALSKTSLDMRPSLALTAEKASNGMREMHLDIHLRDGAVPAEDPVYHGFQRWWVEVQLPAGSTLLSDRGPMEDPDAPNGGSYVADLFPEQTGEINIRFLMNDSDSLLIRRQPGVSVGDVTVTQDHCPAEDAFSTELSADLVVELSKLCGQG